LRSLLCCEKGLENAGGELQQEDIRILRREIEAKKEKLNELTQDAKRLMEQ